MTGILKSGGGGETWRHIDEHGENTEAETGVLQLPSKEYQGLLATPKSQEEARKDTSFESSEGARPC